MLRGQDWKFLKIVNLSNANILLGVDSFFSSGMELTAFTQSYIPRPFLFLFFGDKVLLSH